MSHPETDPAGADGIAAAPMPTPIEPTTKASPLFDERPVVQADPAVEADPTKQAGPAVQPPISAASTHGPNDARTSDRARPRAAAAAAAAAASMGMNTPHQAARRTRRPQNYAAAVYGSVLAATVIISAGDLRSPLTLAVLLVTSGLVFWIAHVYAATVASVHGGWHYGAIRTGMSHEWPVAFAAIPPAVAALISGLLPDVSVTDGVWAALIVSLAEQQLWGYAAVRHARLSGSALTRTMLLNVFMGFIIVALKLGVGH